MGVGKKGAMGATHIRWPSGCPDPRISCDKASLIIIGIISVFWSARCDGILIVAPPLRNLGTLCFGN